MQAYLTSPLSRPKNRAYFLEELHKQMAENNLASPESLILDGNIHRYSADHKQHEKDEWYVAYEYISTQGNYHLVGIYGSWSTSSKHIYKSYDTQLSHTTYEHQELAEQVEKKSQEIEDYLQQEHNTTAQKAEQLWQASAPVAPSDDYGAYLKAKGVPPITTKFGLNTNGYPSLIIDFRNTSGTLRTLHYISYNSHTQQSYKSFLKGGEKKGNFHTIGIVHDGDDITIAEGYATGISIYLATQKPVIVAGDIGNIQNVIEQLQKQYPTSTITIAGELGSSEKGLKIATILGTKLAFPQFPEQKQQSVKGKRYTDFNDLHTVAGLEEVKHQLARAQKPPLYQNNHSRTTRFFQFINKRPLHFLLQDAPEVPRLVNRLDEQRNISPFIRKGIVGQVVGAGGIGKTHWLTQLALALVTGTPFLGKYPIEKPGYVLLVLGENSDEDIHRLLRKTFTSLSPLRQQESQVLNACGHLAGNRLATLSVTGANASFITTQGEPSPFFTDLLSKLKEEEPEEGWSCIIFDPISRFLGSDAENDNAAATRFISLLERITLELQGKPTVLFGHHMSKSGLSNTNTDQTAARGSSAITDGVRLQINLERIEKDDKDEKYERKRIRMRVVKSNHTATLPAIILIKDSNGCLSVEEEETDSPDTITF